MKLNHGFLMLVSVLTTGCSAVKYVAKHAEAPREKPSVLQRGWVFVESEQWRTRQRSDNRPVNFATPVIHEERVIYGTADYGLYAVHKDSGRMVWQKRIVGGISSEPAVDSKQLFVGTDRGEFYAINMTTGAVAWMVDLSMPIIGKPVIYSGRVYVATANEKVAALDVTTGKQVFTYSRRQVGSTTVKGGGRISVIAGRLWIGFSDGTLVSLDPNDGSVQFEKQYIDNRKFTDIDAKPLPWRENVLVATYDGKLRNLRRDGRTIWEFPVGSAREPLIINDKGGILFYAGSDGYVYSVAAANGKELWRQEIKQGTATGMHYLAGSGTLVVASSDKFVYAFDAFSGQPLDRYSLGGGSGSFGDMIGDDNQVFLLSNRGRLFNFRVVR